MLIVVNKHERAARVLAKQLHFNHWFLFKIQEKSAVKMMAIVIYVPSSEHICFAMWLDIIN